MDEARKLRRGLKDISSLFSEKEEAAMPAPVSRPRVLVKETALQLISLAHPGKISSFNLHQRMAEQTGRAGFPATVISLVSSSVEQNTHYSKGTSVRHRIMDMAEFEKNCIGTAHAVRNTESSLMFLDFSWHHAPLFEKTTGLLDKVIFWVTPEMEALSQVYKWIKWVSGLNSRVECLLAYDGDDERKGSFLFEKLSEMVSRRLGKDLAWFGCHPIAGVSELRSLDIDLLFTQTNPLTLSEKQALAQSVLES